MQALNTKYRYKSANWKNEKFNFTLFFLPLNLIKVKKLKINQNLTFFPFICEYLFLALYGSNGGQQSYLPTIRSMKNKSRECKGERRELNGFNLKIALRFLTKT